MKHQWLAYVIVGLLSIGAGVAIAGLPNNVPVDATIIPPTTTEAPTPTAPETTVATTTPPRTTVPVASETTGPTTTGPATTGPTTTGPATTGPTTTGPVNLPARKQIIVGAANGAGIAGTAARAVTRLVAVGYVDVTPLDGTKIVDLTTIYYADGFQAAAARMAADLSIAPDLIAPLADAPDVANLRPDTQLLEYVGIDRAR